VVVVSEQRPRTFYSDAARLVEFPWAYPHELAHYATARAVGLDAEIDMWTRIHPATRIEGRCTRAEAIAVLLAPAIIFGTLAYVIPESLMSVAPRFGLVVFILSFLAAIGSTGDVEMAVEVVQEGAEFEGFVDDYDTDETVGESE